MGAPALDFPDLLSMVIMARVTSLMLHMGIILLGASHLFAEGNRKRGAKALVLDDPTYMFEDGDFDDELLFKQYKPEFRNMSSSADYCSFDAATATLGAHGAEPSLKEELQRLSALVQDADLDESAKASVQSIRKEADSAMEESKTMDAADRPGFIAKVTLRISKKLVEMSPPKALLVGIMLQAFCFTGYGGWYAAAAGAAHCNPFLVLVGTVYGSTMTVAAPILHGVGLVAIAHGFAGFESVDRALTKRMPNKMQHLKDLLEKARKFEEEPERAEEEEEAEASEQPAAVLRRSPRRSLEDF